LYQGSPGRSLKLYGCRQYQVQTSVQGRLLASAIQKNEFSGEVIGTKYLLQVIVHTSGGFALCRMVVFRMWLLRNKYIFPGIKNIHRIGTKHLATFR
jgi:hypothetical protein